MKIVLFACTHNAGRSQMAAAWLNRLADPAKVRATSAGTSPATDVHPEVVEVMREVDIDLSTAKPTRLTGELAESSSLLVTMGCREHCPVVPGLQREDWPLEDPKGRPIAQVRAIRDAIRDRVSGLIARNRWGREGGFRRTTRSPTS